MRPYLYDLKNCIVYKKPRWTSRQALIQLALTFNEMGACFALWDKGIFEARRRGNTISSNLPITYKEYAVMHGFSEKDFDWGD